MPAERRQTRWDYSWVDFKHAHLFGFTKLLDTAVKLNGWWWKYGAPLENGDTGRRYFLCRYYHKEGGD